MDYLKYLQQEIHSAVFSTVDNDGLPQTCVIDIMLADANSLYFLTAKGKNFYERLMAKPFAAVCGMTGDGGTLSKKTVSVRGKVRNIGNKLIPEIFRKNSYMNEIYPTAQSRMALEVFQLYEGTGEFFDLSQLPPVRESFTFGSAESKKAGYEITTDCIGCGSCTLVCPVNCIHEDAPFVIVQKNCIHCGNCHEICPVQAVIKLC